MYVHVSVHCCLVFVQSIKERLGFVPVASTMARIQRDCLVLASYAKWPEIQPHSQIVSADPPLLRDRQINRKNGF